MNTADRLRAEGLDPDSMTPEEVASACEQVIYVAGFVSDGGVGGFEWREDRDDLEQIRQGWIEEGDNDVSPIREVVRPDGDGEAITAYLDSVPELWEPKEGER